MKIKVSNIEPFFLQCVIGNILRLGCRAFLTKLDFRVSSMHTHARPTHTQTHTYTGIREEYSNKLIKLGSMELQWYYGFSFWSPLHCHGP